MNLRVRSTPSPQWSRLPAEQAAGVEGKVLYKDDRIILAMLRFAETSTITPHAADFDVEVVCLSGSGMTSVGDERAELREGQTVRWPAGMVHGLWTEAEEMVTLMVEHHV